MQNADDRSQVVVCRLTPCGPETSRLHLVGGGARNELWQRILADLFQVPVEVPDVTETAARGAALKAAAV
jgi:sugar (pentulose or hexulose) kinase